MAFLESQLAAEDAAAKVDTPAKRYAVKEKKKRGGAKRYAEFAELAGPPRAEYVERPGQADARTAAQAVAAAAAEARQIALQRHDMVEFILPLSSQRTRLPKLPDIFFGVIWRFKAKVLHTLCLIG